MWQGKRWVKMKLSFLTVLLLFVLAACQFGDASSEIGANKTSEHDFYINHGGETLHIIAGSEQKELEPMVADFANEHNQSIIIDYMGSLDIMRLLESGEMGEVDAVWPASSIWLTLGGEHGLLKHQETTSQTPVVFGVKQSLAEQLGYVDNDNVTVAELMQDIEQGDLNFAMTNATQSNSGASAYLGFLTALDPTPEDGLSVDDLENDQLQRDIKAFLAGVNRSSGSSNWLRDLFVQSGGQYDAMVNYEQLIIQTNIDLVEQGEEPLYAIYPSDGLTISDAPLAYVDQGNDEKEEAFLALQAYLLSDDVQSEIEQVGKRNAYGEVRPENQELYKAEWGIQPNEALVPIRFPQAEAIQKSLVSYQTIFKKPALTFYVLDYSGSMSGAGVEQMEAAIEQVLIPENARKNLLQGTEQDVTYVLPFNDDVGTPERADGNDDELNSLYQHVVTNYEPFGSTYLYEGVFAAIDTIISNHGDTLDDYSVSIIVLSDGDANGDIYIDEVPDLYQAYGVDIPVFSILFGSANEEEMEELARITNAKVFDGREDLIGAFQEVKGYN